MGASTSVYASRVGGFAGAVKEYQSALIAYRQAILSNAPAKAVAKQKAHLAFQKMQHQFQHELKIITGKQNSHRGTPLTNANRATNIARSSKSIAKLNVSNQIQASHVVKFANHAKFLGNGLAVIDFTSRVGNVHASYQGGGNWEREMFIESSSFVASVASGALVVKGGMSALTFLMVATPVGWVGLVVGGLAIAGTAAAASLGTNIQTKKKAGGLYDLIMKWLSF